MRAVVHDRYGPPDVLRLEEVERPVPEDDEVLVRVQATTVSRTDCGFRRPRPFFVRAFSGLLRPSHRILGSELAGEVEAVGAAVSEFAVGDQVFGVNADRFGAHADFVCMREHAPLAHKPAGISFEEAAAVCDGATIAPAGEAVGLHREMTIAVTPLHNLFAPRLTELPTLVASLPGAPSASARSSRSATAKTTKADS